MTVSAQETIFRHVGNGITTVFAYSCQVLQPNDLHIYANDVEVTSGITKTGIGTLTGGTVIFAVAPAAGVSIILEREVALERSTDYQQNGDFLARVVNPDFNRIWMALQQLRSYFGRALLVPKSDPVGPTTIPTAASRANKLLGFDASGNPIAVVPNAQSAAALQALLAGTTGASLIGRPAGTVESGLAALEAETARINLLFPKIRPSRPAYIEQHLSSFFGRGMLTSETINITTEQSMVGNYVVGDATLVLTNATNFIVGGGCTIKHDNGRYATYFIDSKSVNNIGIRPALRWPCTAAVARIERLWYNKAHPGRFYMRALAQRIALSTELEAAMPNGGRVLFTNTASNPNTIEDTLVTLNSAAVTYINEDNLGEDGTVSTPVRFVFGRGAFVDNITGVSAGVETQLFPAQDTANAVVKVAFVSNTSTSSFSIQVFDDLNVERGKFIIPNGANHRALQIYSFAADLRGAKYVKVRIACETYGGAGSYFAVNQIDVFEAPPQSAKIIPNPTAKIVVLGDSWAAGDMTNTPQREPYVDQLRLELPYATIINAGVGGNKVTEMLARFATDVAVHNPDYVIINSGTNECYSPLSGTFDPNAIDAFIFYFRRLLNAVAEIGARPIIIGVPALAQTDADVPAFPEWQLNDRAKKYARYVFENQSEKPIVPYGSNANGSWTKFPDGTMTAHHTINVTTTAANTVASTAWTFPVPFAGTPRCVAVPSGYTSNQVLAGGTHAATTASVSVRMVSGTSGITIPLDCIAQGRWR